MLFRSNLPSPPHTGTSALPPQDHNKDGEREGEEREKPKEREKNERRRGRLKQCGLRRWCCGHSLHACPNTSTASTAGLALSNEQYFTISLFPFMRGVSALDNISLTGFKLFAGEPSPASSPNARPPARTLASPRRFKSSNARSDERWTAVIKAPAPAEVGRISPAECCERSRGAGY